MENFNNQEFRLLLVKEFKYDLAKAAMFFDLL